MPWKTLNVAVSDGVLQVEIDRPEKRNALSREVLSHLHEAFAFHARDPSLRLAVLTAVGDKSFAAGGDLKDLGTIRTLDGALQLFRQASAALDAVRRFPVPVVAALNGTALGGGAELAVACDFRIAAAHAGIGFVQGALNISTGFGGGTDLMRLLGFNRALALLATGRVLGAREAQAWGLVDQVADEAEPFHAFVARFIDPLRRQAPQVMRAFKAQALAERLGVPRAEREAAEASLFAQTWIHEDHWAAADRLLAGQKKA